MPDVPTLAESGFKDIEADIWFGVAAPAKTPQAGVSQLIRWFTAALQAPDIRSKLADQGMFAAGICGEDFAAFLSFLTAHIGEEPSLATLRDLKASPLWIAVLASWGVALLEYALQVPANRIGFQQAGYSLQQLKVMQEVITMTVFAAFAAWYMKERITLDFVWAALCLVGAVFFMFRGAR